MDVQAPPAAVSHLLEGLDEAQLRAVTSTASPLCILAGAGSGKTRVLTRRIAHRCLTGDADGRHVLALTFTRKAAGELNHRLRRLGIRDRVAAGTFHAIAYAQLRSRWADNGTRPPTLLDRKLRLIGRMLPRSKTGPVNGADVASEIEWAKARLIAPSSYATEARKAGRRPPLEPAAMAAVYERYEEEKKRARMVDFDDLLLLCITALESDSEFAAAQRWSCRHLFVDEFQDVNPLQYRLLEAWRGDRTDLCVVGDPNQAIYSWNGADASYLVDFTSRFPTAETITLDSNYRSSPQILALANQVLPLAGRRGARLRPTKTEGPLPVINAYATDVHEARAIARAIHDHHQPGVPWSHQAVLTRTHAQGVLLEEAFRAVHIPFRTRGRAPFLDLPEIKDALRSLSNSPFVEGMAALEATVRASLPSLDDEPDTSSLDLDDPDGPGRSPRRAGSEAELTRLRNLEALLRLANEYTADDNRPTGPGFGGWLAATVRSESPDGDGDAVEIATFHAAKGLEWPIVYVAGLEMGLVPIGHARSPEAEAEERRLFYVAITRAERELFLSWAQQRTFGSRTANRYPSPFLDEAESSLGALSDASRPADWRPHVAAQRQRLRSSAGGIAGPGAGGRRGSGRPARGKGEPANSGSEGHALSQPGDVALYDDLKRWRATAAKAANVPAFVIFHDRTLQAVAEARPHDQRALLRISGLGPVKASRFGDDLLAVVQRHTGEANDAPEAAPGPPPAVPTSRSDADSEAEASG